MVCILGLENAKRKTNARFPTGNTIKFIGPFMAVCFPSRLPEHIVCVPVPINTRSGTNESSNVISDCRLTFTMTCYGCQTLTNCSSLWGTACLECYISIAIQAHDFLLKSKRERPSCL